MWNFDEGDIEEFLAPLLVLVAKLTYKTLTYHSNIKKGRPSDPSIWSVNCIVIILSKQLS